jgi:hypothetical protein
MGGRSINKNERGSWTPFSALTRRWLGARGAGGRLPVELDIPPQREYSADVFDIRPREVQRWIEDLPLVNVGQAGRDLFQALVSTNGMDIPAKARLPLLESLREPVSSVMRSLRRHYVGVGFPLPEKNRNVARLAEAMCRAMATGYKAITRDLLLVRAPPSSQRLALAIHRSIRYLSQVLLVNCHAYAPCPAGAWLEIHQLFRHAEQSNVETLPIQDSSYGLVSRGSVADAYKQVVMLALTDPYRLPQAETENLYAALEIWAPLVLLGPCDQRQGPSSFMVNLARDQAPLTFSFEEEPLEACRSIDASGMIPDLREELRRAAAHPTVAATPHPGLKPGEFLSEGTLARLLASWDTKPERREPRVAKAAQVPVIRGLSAIHEFLVAGRERRDLAAPPGLEPEPLSRLGLPLSQWGTREHLVPGSSATGTAPQGGRSDTASHGCHILDESVGGCRLQWSASDLGGVNIGELLLVGSSEEQLGSRERLGVIRWMRQQQGEAPETGVQWLASVTLPVWTEAVHGPARTQEFLKALVLPERALAGRSFTLVTGPLSYRPGYEITVRSGDSDKVFRLEGLVERTAAYAQFQVGTAERSGGQTRAPASAQPPPRDDFDTLWETL